jgi:adenosylcobyric acid synthase
MANFTDFDALAAEPSVSLAFLDKPEQTALADAMILPGTKQTLDDLEWARERGFTGILSSYEGTLIGICGGLQMLGLSIEDSSGVESGGHARTMEGLGRLPIRTIMRGEKTVRRATGRTQSWTAPDFRGYEIHMGETVYENDAQPFAEIVREGEVEPILDGAIASSGRIWGTYVHGIFDDDAFRHAFVNLTREQCGLAPSRSHICFSANRQARIDRWADHLRQSLDMKRIRELAGTQ